MIIFIDYVSVTVHYNVMFHFFHLTSKSAKKRVIQIGFHFRYIRVNTVFGISFYKIHKNAGK